MLRWLRKSIGLAPPIDLREFNLVLRSARESADLSARVVWSDLLPRQQQIARLVARGLSVQEISREIQLNWRAVEVQVRFTLMAKTGASNLAELKAWIDRNMPA